MIEITNLVKRYGNKFAVDDISFTVGEGEIIGFLGPNGAGKSTTMNIITGYLSSTSGMVKVDGIDIMEDPMAAKKKIGFLPEQPPLYVDMTVWEYLSFVYELRRAGNDLLIDRQDFAKGSINIVDLALDISSAYEFTVICNDSFGGSASRTYLLECERVELNIAKNRIGVGKYASEDQLLDCAWRIRCGGDIEFTSESGMLVSLREALRSYSGGECSLGGIYDVTTEAQLSSVLSPKADGVGISIVFVSAPSLSLGVGGYVILTYKNEYVSGYKVISTL